MNLTVPGLQFGDKVKHIIYGIEGIVVGVAMYDTGCIHINISLQKLDKDGKPRESKWYDIEKLKKVPKSKRLKLADHTPKGKKNGGPGKSHPPARSHG